MTSITFSSRQIKAFLACAGALAGSQPAVAADEPMGDPFGLEQARQASRTRVLATAVSTQLPPGTSSGPTTVAVPPSIRVLATLTRGEAACAVLHISGATHRLRVGDTLPEQLGRIARIGIDTVELQIGDEHRVLRLDETTPRPGAGIARRKAGAPA